MKVTLIFVSLLCTLCFMTDGAVITGACERDSQCPAGTCCAASLWLRGLRTCTPLGGRQDLCHPYSHKVPYWGRRRHYVCPCLPSLACVRSPPVTGRHRCSSSFSIIEGLIYN
ncbi:toxin MIT1 [Petromyzon marinus]|uniref:Toxin MIT1-like n=2 Tax=Petromyzon marinus TaxID=7757 RepID=A0AAJ7WU22_PETMA|nr:toxin MIT1-like [Petromyzon marinus]